MILSTGTEVITKPYREKDTEKIVRLIHRNFMGRGLAVISLIPLNPIYYS